MFYPFTFLQIVLCTEEKLERLEENNKTATKTHSAACDALESELEKISKDFCKSAATEDDILVVYADLLDVFGKSVAEFANRVTQFRKFDENFPGDVKDESSKDILKLVKFLEGKFESDFFKLTSILNVKTSFTEVYSAKLSKLDYVLDYSDVKPVLENANKMFKNVWNTYYNVATAFKAYYDKKIAILKQKGDEKAIAEKKQTVVSQEQKDSDSLEDSDIFTDSQKDSKKDEKSPDKKDGQTSYKTIIIVVVAVVGGLIVVGLLFYELYFKKKNNQRNNENDTEQADVEEIPDGNYYNQNYRNGREFPNGGYQNDNQLRHVEYQNNNRSHYISGGNNHPPYQGNDNYRRVN